MRKLAAFGVALIVFACSACSCPAEVAAIKRLDDQQEKLFKKYEVYVASDPKLDAAGKNDEMALVKSLRDMMTSIKKSLGD